jgi:hypothetical protein
MDGMLQHQSERSEGRCKETLHKLQRKIKSRTKRKTIMAYKKKEVSVQTKFTRVYEDEDTKSVWTYDLNKTKSGPVSVEITYKNLPVATKKKTAKKKAVKKKVTKKVIKV